MTMLKDLIASIFGHPGAVRVLPAVAATVAALVFGVSAGGSLSAPRIFISSVRIKLPPDTDHATSDGSKPNASGRYDPLLMQTECEVLRSEMVLAHVANALGGNRTHRARQIGNRERPDIPGRIAQLRNQIEVSPVWSDNAINVRVISEDRGEAVQIAHALLRTIQRIRVTCSKVCRLPSRAPARRRQ
jgi:hypothetical protein